MNKDQYQQYLLSEHWQKTRRLKLKEANYTCQRCHKRNTELHIHHTPEAYRYLYQEPLCLLECLCKDCHFSEHYSHQDFERKLKDFLRGK